MKTKIVEILEKLSREGKFELFRTDTDESAVVEDDPSLRKAIGGDTLLLLLILLILQELLL